MDSMWTYTASFLLKHYHKLDHEQDGMRRDRREPEAGQSTVGQLRLQYEKQSGAIANLGHHTNKVNMQENEEM